MYVSGRAVRACVPFLPPHVVRGDREREKGWFTGDVSAERRGPAAPPPPPGWHERVYGVVDGAVLDREGRSPRQRHPAWDDETIPVDQNYHDYEP